jgi:hypothetical protein
MQAGYAKYCITGYRQSPALRFSQETFYTSLLSRRDALT